MNTLNTKYQKIHPLFVPRGVEENDILSKVRKSHPECLQKKGNKCCVCEGTETVDHIQVFFHYDLKSRSCIVDRVGYVCNDCKALLDVNYILNVCFNLKDKEEVYRNKSVW